MSKRKPTPGLQEALDRLASLFEYGALEASTMPAVFIGHVCEEIERLRAGQRASQEAARRRVLDAAIDWSKFPKLAGIFEHRPRVNVYWQELAAFVAALSAPPADASEAPRCGRVLDPAHHAGVVVCNEPAGHPANGRCRGGVR